MTALNSSPLKSESSAIYVFTLKALSDVLAGDAKGDGGLPVPPLLEIITAYVIDASISVLVAVERVISIACTASAEAGRTDLIIGCYGGASRWYESLWNRLVPVALSLDNDSIPYGICVDHSVRHRVYTLTRDAVYRIERGAISKLCDRTKADSGLASLVFSPDQKELWFDGFDASRAHGVQSVTIASPHTRRVVVHSGECISAMVWSRSAAHALRSILYLRHGNALGWFDAAAKGRSEVVTIKLSRDDLLIFGIESFVSGHVLVSCRKTRAIWCIEPSTGACTELVGPSHGVTFRAGVSDIACVDSEYALAAIDFGADRIVRIPLPAFLFTPPKRDSSVAAT